MCAHLVGTYLFFFYNLLRPFTDTTRRDTTGEPLPFSFAFAFNANKVGLRGRLIERKQRKREAKPTTPTTPPYPMVNITNQSPPPFVVEVSIKQRWKGKTKGKDSQEIAWMYEVSSLFFLFDTFIQLLVKWYYKNDEKEVPHVFFSFPTQRGSCLFISTQRGPPSSPLFFFSTQ